MNANVTTYLLFGSFLIALIGLSLAYCQDLKQTTRASDTRWTRWMLVFAICVMIDAVMLARPWA